MVIQLWVSSHIGLIRNSLADQLDDYHRTEISLQEEIIENHVIVIYIRVRDVNFPARQLVSGTMAQPSA
jgi:hypothetical protein